MIVKAIRLTGDWWLWFRTLDAHIFILLTCWII